MAVSADVRYERLTLADLPGIEHIEAETGLGFWGRDSYKRLIEDEEYVYARVAKIEERVVGFIVVRFLDEEAEIMKIGVDPEFQRQGIGSNLIRLCFEEGRRRGCRSCFLEVRKSNLNAIKFYLDHDFEFYGYRRNYYTNPLEDAHVMRRRL